MSSGACVEGVAPGISIGLRARMEAAAPILVFAGAFVWLWLRYGHRLILNTNDEGIYLDAAQRILHGQKPYVDFFGYMSPGSFWAQALAFRLFGLTLAAGRLPVILYLATECGLIYWLVARFASRGAAIVTALFFFAFETADPTMITAQHRWDSSALSLASVALCVGSDLEWRSWRLVSAGILIVLAALATPSLALVAVVTVVWLAWPAGRRIRAAWFLTGMAAAGAVAGAVLWSDRMLGPLLQQVVWLSRNYSANNAMPYGAIIGGYRTLLEGAGIGELPVRLAVVFCLALPAVLPIVALAGGSLLWLQRQSGGESLRSAIPYLLVCVVALAVSTYPRSDVAHLAYVAALPYALTGILLYRHLPSRPRAWLTLAIGVWAAVFSLQSQLIGKLQPLHTPVGDVRASAAEAPVVRDLLTRVRPHQSLFVYPYKPLLYFLTQAENPTRYPYLEAGMMTQEDARLALAELEARPPEWMLYMNLDRSEFERVFPAATSLDPHYPRLESWIKANYRASDVAPLGGYTLLRRAQ